MADWRRTIISLTVAFRPLPQLDFWWVTSHISKNYKSRQTVANVSKLTQFKGRPCSNVVADSCICSRCIHDLKQFHKFASRMSCDQISNASDNTNVSDFLRKLRNFQSHHVTCVKLWATGRKLTRSVTGLIMVWSWSSCVPVLSAAGCTSPRNTCCFFVELTKLVYV